jgi:deoxyribodipyrimidine photo-lyase
MKRALSSPTPSTSHSSKKQKSTSKLFKEIQECREEIAPNIKHFNFNKKRVRIINEISLVPEEKSGIAYWMARDQRVQDNWALLFAQKLAFKNYLPLHVVFCLSDKFAATLRQFKFMIEGLKEVEKDLRVLNINFHLLKGDPSQEIPKFVKNFNIGCLVCDFSPLKFYKNWIDEIKENLQENVPFVQVDAHNIVPTWIASDKQEYSARTIRNKINSQLDGFLTKFPPLIEHPHDADEECDEIDWKEVVGNFEVDESVKEVDWAVPGYRGEFLYFYINF